MRFKYHNFVQGVSEQFKHTSIIGQVFFKDLGTALPRG